MNKLVYPVILSLLFITACSDNATDSVMQPVNDRLVISGALNTRFESSQFILSQEKYSSTRNLFFFIQAATDTDNFWQRSSFKFFIQIDSIRRLNSGQIYEISHTQAGAKFIYQSRWDENIQSEIQFEIDGGEILFDRLDGETYSGKFKIWAHQSAGRRMMHGQVEDLLLSNNGEINISGEFTDIPLKHR